MKKLIPVILTLTMILCSCSAGGARKPPAMPAAVEGRFNVEYSGTLYSALITLEPNGEYTVSLNEPDGLSGLKLVYSGGGFTVETAGLELEYLNGELEDVCPFAQLAAVFGTMKTRAASSVDEKDGAWEYAYDSPDGAYTVKVSAASGKVTEIDTGKYRFEAAL